MSRRKQAKPIRHLEDGTTPLNGKIEILKILFIFRLKYERWIN